MIKSDWAPVTLGLLNLSWFPDMWRQCVSRAVSLICSAAWAVVSCTCMSGEASHFVSLLPHPPLTHTHTLAPYTQKAAAVSSSAWFLSPSIHLHSRLRLSAPIQSRPYEACLMSHYRYRIPLCCFYKDATDVCVCVNANDSIERLTYSSVVPTQWSVSAGTWLYAGGTMRGSVATQASAVHRLTPIF